MYNEKIKNFKNYNNYINKKFDYSSLISSINLSIDFTKLFFRYDSISSHDFLKLANNIFDSVHVIHKNYRHFKAYKLIDNVNHFFRFSFIFKDNYFLGISLRIGHPDKSVVDFIENNIPYTYAMSAVEYSVDFRGSDPYELFRLIRTTAHIRWPGKNTPSSYATTYYLSNSRTSLTSGCYAYIKFNTPEKPFVRLELRARNHFYKRKNIKKVRTALSLRPSEVFKNLSFSYVDLKALLVKSKLALNFETDNEENNVILNKFFGLIMNQSIFNDLESDSGIVGLTGVKQKVSSITKNSSTIYKKHEFNQIFFESIENQSFI